MGSEILPLMAPLSGAVVPLSEVPDPVFAQKLMGDGIAIDPTSSALVAPFDGKVVQLHAAHHAVTIESAGGIQVLMHIGVDSVLLKGKGFTPRVKIGDSVRRGQALIEFDSDFLAQNAKSLVTPIIVLGESKLFPAPKALVTTGDLLLEVSGKQVRPTGNGVGDQSAESELFGLKLANGMHARPAALIVNKAKSFSSEIQLWKGSASANAKSVVSILGLEIAAHDTLKFSAMGPDAEQAVSQLAELLSSLEERAMTVPQTPPAAKRVSRPGVLVGVGISPGLAIGRVRQIKSVTSEIPEVGESPAAEHKKLEAALTRAQAELGQFVQTVKAQGQPAQASIFAAHQELIQDPDILESTHKIIATGKSAAFSWNEAIRDHSARLAASRNELLANRANDLRDVGQRVLNQMLGTVGVDALPIEYPAILVAENLTPSQTMQLDRKKIVAFCTTTGGATSHVAILARALGLPAIAGLDPAILNVADQTEVIVDGENGKVRMNPVAEEKAAVLKEQQAQNEKRLAALALADRPAQTRDGFTVEVAANIGSVAEAREAVELGADGVGLLRSEFLFLERDQAPTEEEQRAIYQEIADTLGAKPLIIRTLDVGGDKPLKYLPLPPEENPFLGIRGIRVGLRNQEILRTQLRAILRVKSKAELHIMFPMVATLSEWRAARAILHEEKAKLKNPAQVKVGIMVEVPSVALTADDFAAEVDFFSIGTNDLTQYVLAMDRGHKDLAKDVDAYHPSVLKLIELTVQAAHRHGKWAGVCGGLASDLKAVPTLVSLGVDELSVSLPAIPLVKAKVRETNKGKTNENNQDGVFVPAENR